MSETRDLIGIYGAIDRAVANDPSLRDSVARLLPIYANEDVRWFDTFEKWTLEKREQAGAETSEPPFPEPAQGLKNLARRAPRARMRARRIFAVAVAQRAFPERLHPEGDWAPHAKAALRRATLVDQKRSKRDHAHGLLELMHEQGPLEDSGEPAPEAWWQRLLAEGEARGHLRDSASMGPHPCTGRLVMVDLPGGPEPVATLRTEFDVHGLDFDRATCFLHPENWPGCSDFWCEMREVGRTPAGVHQFHEQVSTDCKDKAAGWTVQAALDFSFRSLPGAAVAEYQLSQGHPKEGDDVVVDEGSLVVHRVATDAGDVLKVTTTKRVRFSERHAFNGVSLAMLMCALGYADVAADLVYSCAKADPDHPGIPFPGREPAAAEAGQAQGQARGPAPKGAPEDLSPMIRSLADEATAAFKRCVDDWAEAAQASARKVADGKYTADAFVQDIAGLWARTMREGAAAVDRSVRATQETARPRAADPPRDGPCDPP